MISAPIPLDEDQRLQTLCDYQLLDTEAEQAFDDLTQLASQICQTPIALISLIDKDRQWFKAKVGLNASETHRDLAFCSHVVYTSKFLQVQDTLQDIRFFDNPLVTGPPHIRFYAGTPLIAPNGHILGTLCVIDTKPNGLSEQQVFALEVLAREIISQLELRENIKTLNQVSQHKSDFISNMSHELRTPLNAILSFTELLKLNPQQIFNHPKYLEHIEYSARLLLSLVNTLLDIGKIEEGKMELLPKLIDCQYFFAQISSLMQVKAEAKGVHYSAHIDTDLPEYLFMDEEKLSQILLNLLNNAIKFTPAGKSVRFMVMSENQSLKIVVEDKGVGISKEDQKRLFNKYEQLGRLPGRNEGTGLGLSICKSLIELFKGQINLRSTPEIGTLIQVSIPVPMVTPETSNSLKIPVNARALNTQYRPGCKILVVEDNSINREVAVAIFDQLGLSIDMVESGEAALQQVANAQYNYDLIFMDLHLPGIDGLETSRRLKQYQPALTIVALSADVLASSRDTSETPFADFLTKPIELPQLIRVLNHYLSG